MPASTTPGAGPTESVTDELAAPRPGATRADPVRIYTHVDCAAHDPGADHAERPDRLAVVVKALRWIPGLDWQDATEASREQLARVHDGDYVDRILDAQVDGTLRLDADTVMSPGSARAAALAAGAAVAAVDWVMAAPRRLAFCAVRPPGHHALRDAAMGFCLFNSVAVAAAHALAVYGLERIAIADFDVHHGNGTQALFADEPRVLFASSHQWPLYPGTGAVKENRPGHILNAPLLPGSGGREFLAAWRKTLLPAIDAFAPQLVLVSAGFDAHRLDPLAQLEVEAGDYAALTRDLLALADRHADGRLVSMLEGGYSLEGLAESAWAHVDALDRG
jgi:acetoin utilization deacetylase AcuC-like enzyme